MLTEESVRDAVVVLAYRLSDQGKMEPPLIMRLDMGVRRFRQERKQAVIVCGWRANKREDLGRFSEAELMRDYIHNKHGAKIPVLLEPDSTSIQENLLFTRARFPALRELTIVTAARALERTRYHAEIVFTGNAHVSFAPCSDGVSAVEREIKMCGDVRCILESRGVKPGEWKKLILPPQNGRLRSRWSEWATAHESCYWRRNHLRHPGTP